MPKQSYCLQFLNAQNKDLPSLKKKKKIKHPYPPSECSECTFSVKSPFQ